MPSAESGDEVQFGLSLSSPKTRTIYGYGEKTETSYPIYWVNGDKVQIYSPQCLSGRNNAEYQVSVDGAKQKYASSLTPTGANGVQWGTEASDFYSVYPSGDYTISDDGKSITDIKINFSNDFEVVDGAVVPKQADCLMFASTKQVAVGSTVNLLYSPIATSVTFTINGPTSGDPVTIQSVKLIAPTGTYIAGNFNVKLCEDESANKGKYIFTDWAKDDNGRTNSSETISVQIYDKSTGEFHKIGVGESLPISFFLVPRTDLAITENWKIQVVTTNKTFTKSLAFGTEANTNLAPGMVHELPSLPKLDEGTAAWSVTDWMKNIPRNVYLSEVSIPGSWDSINGEKQGQTDIATQYGYGVRAFHFDTRWRTSGTGSLLGYTSGSVNALSVAGAGDSSKLRGVDSDNNRVVLGGAKKFEELLDQVVSKLSPDEYMVLVCTFAQDSYDYEGTNGRWYGEISAICAQDKYENTLVDAKGISSNTLVGDVLGRLLVIVNMPEEINSETALPADSRCLFTFMPLMLSASHFDGTDDNQDKLWISNIVDDKAKAKDSGIIVYNTHAQATANRDTPYDTGTSNRGYAPTIAQRQNICNNILSWSKNNYNKADYAHNMWIYLGLGGYCIKNTSASEASGGPSTIASSMNNWINGKVSEMGTIPSGQTEVIPYYPVGIVLMNYVDQYQGTVKNILLLNNKYRLQYNPNMPTDYNPNAKARSAAASYSSGMHDTGTSAFGWE